MKGTKTASSGLAIGLAVLTAACAGTSEKDSLKNVDSLVARIERVHVEAELSRETIRQAVGLLQVIVDPEFDGDPVVAYADFVASVERSEKQADVFRGLIDPMRGSAEKVFDQWAADLDVFTSPGMRTRSQERLVETRNRFQAVISSVEPTADSFDTFNQTLRDHVLFLQHDFNPAAVKAIGGEVKSLGQLSSRLDKNLNVCMKATIAYVRSTALPGEMVVQEAEPVAAPEENLEPRD